MQTKLALEKTDAIIVSRRKCELAWKSQVKYLAVILDKRQMKARPKYYISGLAY